MFFFMAEQGIEKPSLNVINRSIETAKPAWMKSLAKGQHTQGGQDAGSPPQQIYDKWNICQR